ncbi:MAG: D-alanyl-D-alanine carboxypeptidase [Candidatus Niyogibacteria bacterium]|nr:D-alanyl-D-alanine carboxypeptidase [Candidatus Niyogibacteria bacterium]
MFKIKGLISFPLIFSFLFLVFIWNISLPENFQEAAVAVDGFAKSGTEFSELIAETNIEGQSYLVFDFFGRIIASRKSDLQWPLASLTKLMTALLTEENIGKEAVISVSRRAISAEGDDGFLAEEIFRRDDLRDAMLIHSSNDAAYALAEHFGWDEFIKLMNQKAAFLGMAQTFFFDPAGLDFSKTSAGAYGSAGDLMILLGYLMENHPQVLEATRLPFLKIESLEGNKHRFTNTNRLIYEIPQFLAGKTGFTDIAGGNLAVVADIGINQPVGIIILGSSEKGRFEDVLKLYQATRKWFQNHPLLFK